MFGLSGEHLLILAAVLLIFGPRKLPELGASVGKALRNFKEGLNNPASSGKLDTREPGVPLAQNLSQKMDATIIPSTSQSAAPSAPMSEPVITQTPPPSASV